MFRAQELEVNAKINKNVLSDVTMHIAFILWHLVLLSVFLQCLFKLCTLAKKGPIQWPCAQHKHILYSDNINKSFSF